MNLKRTIEQKKQRTHKSHQPSGLRVVQGTGSQAERQAITFIPLPNIQSTKFNQILSYPNGCLRWGMDLSFPYPFRGLGLGGYNRVKTPIFTQNQPLEILDFW